MQRSTSAIDWTETNTECDSSLHLKKKLTMNVALLSPYMNRYRERKTVVSLEYTNAKE